jgi:hypothetical protein
MVDITPADLFKTGQSQMQIAEPSLLTQINEFMSRAENLFREGTQFLANLAEISNNPTLKKIAAKNLGITPKENVSEDVLDKNFNQLIGMLELFKLKNGDVPLSKLIEWLKTNKQMVIDGMKTQLAAK